MTTLPVIDLFAGPGGLGEGFSALRGSHDEACFRIRLSIEKDEYAHSTLELRSFFRQFPSHGVPPEYYRHLRQEITREELFRRYPAEAGRAGTEAWLAELGAVPEEQAKDRVREALRGRDPWVLIGGPPCQAYSIVGRSRRRGVHGYVADRDARQTLYKEYLSIIANHWPAVFVMENVKGLLSAKHNGTGMFERMCTDLQSPADAVGQGTHGRTNGRRYKYTIHALAYHGKLWSLNPEDYVVEAEQHGVPQSRHRIILFGVRDDLGCGTPQSLPFSAPVPLSRALEGLPRLRSGLSGREDSSANWLAAVSAARERRWLAGARRIAGDDVYQAIVGTLRQLNAPRRGRGGNFVPAEVSSEFAPEWILDQRLGGVCNHETREHMDTDLHRYLFVACFGQVHGRSPRLGDFPPDLMPAHENAERAAALGSGLFADRFRVQLRSTPATTITSHIHKDGHYYIHYDPSQCRSLTVREAARAQTFPDNYLFCGSRTQQFLQVGNAVPPLLAREIARITWRVLA